MLTLRAFISIIAIIANSKSITSGSSIDLQIAASMRISVVG